jgi:hypothetical protein
VPQEYTPLLPQSQRFPLVDEQAGSSALAVIKSAPGSVSLESMFTEITRLEH